MPLVPKPFEMMTAAYQTWKDPRTPKSTEYNYSIDINPLDLLHNELICSDDPSLRPSQWREVLFLSRTKYVIWS